MLEQTHLEDFISFMKKHGKMKDKTSPYQKVNLEINDRRVMVYRSGIVIFEENQIVTDLIQEFLDDWKISNNDFERYHSSMEIEEDEGDTGWKETPKGVWLNDDQTKALVKKLDDEGKTREIEHQNNEYKRYNKDNQTLVINSNGVVYTISGFENFIDILREIISENTPYSTNDHIIAITDLGRWQRIGPVVLVIAEFSKDDMIELQLAGVKDQSLSRSVDPTDFDDKLEFHSSSSFLLLTPEELNKKCQTREEYISYLQTRYRSFMRDKSLKIDETRFVVDEFIDNLHDFPQDREVVDLKSKGSVAKSIGSAIAASLIQHWKDDHYKKTGVKLNKNNFDEINNQPNREDYLKLFLIS